MSTLLHRFSEATGKSVISVQQEEDEMVVTTADQEEFRAFVLDLNSMDDLIVLAADHWTKEESETP